MFRVSDRGAVCTSALRLRERVAIRAGRMFDSISGQVLTKQVIMITGERIMEVGPEGKVTIPAGARVVDLSNATVLPGFIDTHTHVFNTRGKMTSDQSMLIAVENVQSNMRAGFTSLRDMGSHGNGFQDVDLKNAINRGAIDGPRMLVSGRGIAWGATPPTGAPDEGLGNYHRPFGRRRACGRSSRVPERRGAHQALPDRRL